MTKIRFLNFTNMHKRNNVKLLYILGMIPFLASCLSEDRFIYSEKTTDLSKKGGVFFKILRTADSKDYYECEYEIRRLHSKEPFCLKVDANYELKFLLLEPGIYYIDKINAHSLELPSPGIIEQGQIVAFKYGAFEVKPGDVTSFGLLIYDVKENLLTYNNNFKTVKDRLEENKQFGLASKLKEGVFYPSGSAAIKQSDGSIALYSDKILKNIRDQQIQQAAVKKLKALESKSENTNVNK